MELVVSETPSLYIPERELIVSMVDLRFKKISIAELVKKTEYLSEDLVEVVKTVLSRSLKLLTEYSVSFTVDNIEKEGDAEDLTWEYIIVRIRIEVDKEFFDKICEKVIKYAYSGVNPEDATKVLLTFENV